MDIGRLIKVRLEKQGLSVKDFAQLIPCTRESAYRILRKSYLDSNLLLRISIVLKHDFFADCSKCLQAEHCVSDVDTD